MKQKKSPLTEIDIKNKISLIQDKIDTELSKPENEINMNIIDSYFKQIRELDGGVYKKSQEQLSQDLQHICKNSTYAKKKLYMKCLNTFGKRVAAVFILVGVLFGLSIGVYATHESIAEFFLNVKDKFLEVFFNENDIEKAPETIETVYTLGYVPDGYVLSERKIYNKNVKTIWTTSSGIEIIFDQSCINNSEKTLDNEDNNLQIFYIENTKIVKSEKLDQQIFLWNNNRYIYILTISRTISDEECKKIINSLQEYK